MTDTQENPTNEYVTVKIGPQIFGLPIDRVHDVFVPEIITQVPMSLSDIAGVLNLRGRIVTAIDMRRKLGIEPREDRQNSMAVGIEFNGESYGLMIDSVGEVLKLEAGDIDQNPINLDTRWSSVSNGVYRLDGALMVILDVDRVLSGQLPKSNAA